MSFRLLHPFVAGLLLSKVRKGEGLTLFGWLTVKDWVVVSIFFHFHPCLGKIRILTDIFQRGWNHQLEKVFGLLVTNSSPGYYFHGCVDVLAIWWPIPKLQGCVVASKILKPNSINETKTQHLMFLQLFIQIWTITYQKLSCDHQS